MICLAGFVLHPVHPTRSKSYYVFCVGLLARKSGSLGESRRMLKSTCMSASRLSGPRSIEIGRSTLTIECMHDFISRELEVGWRNNRLEAQVIISHTHTLSLSPSLHSKPQIQHLPLLNRSSYHAAWSTSLQVCHLCRSLHTPLLLSVPACLRCRYIRYPQLQRLLERVALHALRHETRRRLWFQTIRVVVWASVPRTAFHRRQ